VKLDEEPTTTDSLIVQAAELPYDQKDAVEIDAETAQERVFSIRVKRENGTRQLLKLI